MPTFDPDDGGRPRRRRPPPPLSPTTLRDEALRYLERFPASEARLRAVLARRIQRAVDWGRGDATTAAAWVDALVADLRESGRLDDPSLATAIGAALGRRGASARGIREKLHRRGFQAEALGEALAARAPHDEADAARAYARRRRLGPFRRDSASRAASRDKDLAALGRAGFSFDLARRIIDGSGTAEEEDDPKNHGGGR